MRSWRWTAWGWLLACSARSRRALGEGSGARRGRDPQRRDERRGGCCRERRLGGRHHRRWRVRDRRGGGVCEPIRGRTVATEPSTPGGSVRDGNALPADGCTGVCSGGAELRTAEDGRRLLVDGSVRRRQAPAGESCDDANNASSDGCSADCTVVEPGYYCPDSGSALHCARAVRCGDSRVQPGEHLRRHGGVVDGDAAAQFAAWIGLALHKPGSRAFRCPSAETESSREPRSATTASPVRGRLLEHLSHRAGRLCATAGQACRRTVCGDGRAKVRNVATTATNFVRRLAGSPVGPLASRLVPRRALCTARGRQRHRRRCRAWRRTASTRHRRRTATCQSESDSCARSAVRDDERTVHAHGSRRVPRFNQKAERWWPPRLSARYAGPAGVTAGLCSRLGTPIENPVLSTDRQNEGKATCTARTTSGQWYRSPPEPGGTGSRASAPIAGTVTLYQTAEGTLRQSVWRERRAVAAVLGRAMVLEHRLHPLRRTTGRNGLPIAVPPWGNQACSSPRRRYDGNPLFFPLDPPRPASQRTRLPAKSAGAIRLERLAVGDEVARVSASRCPFRRRPLPFPRPRTTSHSRRSPLVVPLRRRRDGCVSIFTGDERRWGSSTVGSRSISGAGTFRSTAAVTIQRGDRGHVRPSERQRLSDRYLHAERETDGSTFRLTLSGFGLQRASARRRAVTKYHGVRGVRRRSRQQRRCVAARAAPTARSGRAAATASWAASAWRSATTA